MVFYDLTTIRSEGLVTVPQDVRQFGMAKECLIARQFMLGVVQTTEGLPIYHEVFDGNTAEIKKLLLLVTNVQNLPPEEVVARYKSIADIERGFKVLKSELEIGPVYHLLPDRIRAHAAICFMALILQRVMRSRLCAAHTELTQELALEQLRRIQHHQVRLNGAPPVSGVSSIHDCQSEVLCMPSG